MQLRPVDPAADRPVFKQAADQVRQAIADGDLRPGQQLPAETDLMDGLEVGRNTVRDALALLRSEGLIETVARVGSRVRERPEPVVVQVGPGAVISWRLPSVDERRRHRIPEGVAAVVVRHPDGRTDMYPADRTTIECIPGPPDVQQSRND